MGEEHLKNKKILAIDYGRKYTGLAYYFVGSDPYPIPFGRIKFESDTQLKTEILKIVEDEFIDILVIGIPYFTDGTESTMTKTVKAFINSLEAETSADVFTEDETLTTFEAEERMKQDPRYNFQVDLSKIDELCATIILEQFFKNSQKN